jgi:hypothetical protein
MTHNKEKSEEISCFELLFSALNFFQFLFIKTLYPELDPDPHTNQDPYPDP